MLFRVLKAERMKLKRSPIWIAFLLMPVIPAVLGTINYRANIEILQKEWYSLWTQHTLFTCYFFLPTMIGVYCAYIMRIEHNNQNWNKILTMPVSRKMIFISKMLVVSFMILISEIWIGILFVISGKAAGITSAVPYSSVITWCLFGVLGGMVIASIQLLISIYLKSFALPVAVSFMGGISGLVFLAKHLGHIWPYSLMAYGMNSNSPQELLAGGYVQFVAVCAVYIIAFTALGIKIMDTQDI